MKTITLLIVFLYAITSIVHAQETKKSNINISESEDLCTQLNKVIESGREFETIKGKVKSSTGSVEIFESKVAVPGTRETAIHANAYTTTSVFAKFIQTTNKRSADEKYTEVTNKLNSCNFIMGTMVADEDLSMDARTTAWVPFALTDENKIRYQNFMMELVMEKNDSGDYEVYIRVSYKN
ncbi:MAG: hypothetical protein ACXWCZ_05870 [Flavisolibacter sp.]